MDLRKQIRTVDACSLECIVAVASGISTLSGRPEILSQNRLSLLLLSAQKTPTRKFAGRIQIDFVD